MSDMDELAIYRTALAMSHRHWIWARDRDHRTSFLSPGFREATGHDPDAELGRLPPPVGSGRFHESGQARHDAMTDRRPFRDDIHELVDADGKSRWISVSGGPRWEQDGSFTGFAGIGEDVTSQIGAAQVGMEAAAALRDSQNLLQAVFDGTMALILVLDPAGRLVEVNQACLDIVDAKRSDVLGQAIWDSPWFRESRSRDRIEAAVRKATAGGRESGEVIMMSRTRSAKIVSLSVQPIFGPDGRIRLIIAEGNDITESKRMLERNRSLELERL